jgi:hypothetical protein
LLFFLGLSLILFLSFYYQNYLFQYLNFLFKPLPKRFVEHILQTIQNFIEGLRSLPDKYAIQSIVYNTLAYWLVSAWGLYMLSIALGMDVDFWGSCLLVCLLIVGIMLPAGPGMLGTYQGALMTGLNIFSVEHDKNLTFIFMAYPLNILIVVLFGGYYFLVSKQPFYKKTVV